HGERVGVQIDTAAVKVVIVAPEIERKTTELASFMRGNLDFEFIEVERFRLAEDDFVVVQRRGVVSATRVRGSAAQEHWSWERYESELRIRPDVVAAARRLFHRI